MSLPALSRLLTLLLGMCYLGGVCELDEKEARQNYGKENHDYLLAAKSGGPHTQVQAPQPDGPTPALPSLSAGRTSRAVGLVAGWAAHQTPAVPEGPPPRPRRYLRLSVLRV